MSGFVLRSPKLDILLQMWITGVEYRRKITSFNLLAMQPGTALAFIVARGNAADSNSVCPLLAPGPLIYYFSGAGLMNLTGFPLAHHSSQSRSNWIGALSHVLGCPAAILPPSFSLVSSANLMRVHSTPSPRWVRHKMVLSAVPTCEVPHLQLATS